MQKIYKIIVSIIGTVLLSAIVIVVFAKFPAKGSLYQNQTTSLTSGWHDQNGLETELNKIDFDENHQAILSIPINSHVVNSRSLCFTSRNVSFSIFLGSKLIYDFKPNLNGLYGRYYGDYPHAVPIPAFDGEAELQIKCTSLLENEWTGFDDVVLQDSGMHILSKMRESMPNFLICFVTFGIGTALFIFGMAFRGMHNNQIETVSLGVITMILSMWSNSQNQVMILLTGNSASVHILDILY